MMNPITELTGNEFLLFYGVLIVATLLVSWWWARTSDPTAGMPVPAVRGNPIRTRSPTFEEARTS